jgi:hypothetical protein
MVGGFFLKGARTPGHRRRPLKPVAAAMRDCTGRLTSRGARLPLRFVGADRGIDAMVCNHSSEFNRRIRHWLMPHPLQRAV